MNLNGHVVKIDGSRITDWGGFHDVFKEAFGFPDFYGHNLNAWIDCMGDLHEDTGMLNVTLPNSTALIIEVYNVDAIERSNREILQELASCTAFVNKERIKYETKDTAPIHLVLYS